MSELSKRPDGEAAPGFRPDGISAPEKTEWMPRYVWETCEFCGGEEATATWDYVLHEHAVACRAVEELKLLRDSDQSMALASGMSADFYAGRQMQWEAAFRAATRVLQEIDASGWKP